MTRLLFLCLGNICRSPAAEGVGRRMAYERGIAVHFASAGVGDWHIGSAPDHRMIRTAARRGYDITDQRARAITSDDFHDFDYVLALDTAVHQQALALAPAGRTADLRLLMDFAGPMHGTDVPDPYYGGHDGFETALTLIEDAVSGLLDHLEKALV